MKIWTEINDIEPKKKNPVKHINETRNWFFEKNKIDKPLSTLITKKRKDSNYKQEKRNNTTEIQLEENIMKKLYANKSDNLEETGKFLENL